jgi:hypothetical protein
MIAGLGLGLGIFVSTAVMSVVRCRFCKKSTLLRVDDASCGSAKSNLLERRTKNMASNVSVFYRNRGGLAITRGDGVYMFDDRGNKYLDCCNNVACVGHSHPTVVRAGCEELSRIQTNTRFLHPTRQRYLEKLLVSKCGIGSINGTMILASYETLITFPLPSIYPFSLNGNWKGYFPSGTGYGILGKFWIRGK